MRGEAVRHFQLDDNVDFVNQRGNLKKAVEDGRGNVIGKIAVNPQALAAGKSYVISGLGNYLGAQSQRIVPRRLVTRIAANMFRPDKDR